MRKTTAALLIGGVLAASPAFADLTITQTIAGKMGPIAMDGQSVMLLKGHRMRTDSKVANRNISTIIDLDKQQFITLNHDKKEAEVTDMSAISKSLQEIGAGDVSVTMTPEGSKKEVAGYPCEVYRLAIRVPFQPPSKGDGAMPGMTINMGGPSCLSKAVPGRDDYAAFYSAAAEKGLFISDPRQAKASPGQAKGMVEMYKAMAKAGMPLSSDLTIGFEGGPLAGMMEKMGGSKLTSTVTKVTTDAVADGQFEVPAGYKVKQNK
jgi:hypothetical protein